MAAAGLLSAPIGGVPSVATGLGSVRLRKASDAPLSERVHKVWLAASFMGFAGAESATGILADGGMAAAVTAGAPARVEAIVMLFLVGRPALTSRESVETSAYPSAWAITKYAPAGTSENE